MISVGSFTLPSAVLSVALGILHIQSEGGGEHCCVITVASFVMNSWPVSGSHIQTVSDRLQVASFHSRHYSSYAS
jgi:hypothetical protein